MRESFVNKYIIKIESGHLGNTNYKIISTPSGFTELLQKLQEKLNRIKQLSENDPQYRIPTTFVWSDCATLYPGRTSRIYLSFSVEDNLDAYHRKPTHIKQLTRVIGLLIVIGIIILALIGGVTIVRALF